MMQMLSILVLTLVTTCLTLTPESHILPAQLQIVPSNTDVTFTCKVYQTNNITLAIWTTNTIKRKVYVAVSKLRFDPRPYFSSVVHISNVTSRDDLSTVKCYDKIATLWVQDEMEGVDMDHVFEEGALEVRCNSAGSPRPGLELHLTTNYLARVVEGRVSYDKYNTTTGSHTVTWRLDKALLHKEVTMTCLSTQHLHNRDVITFNTSRSVRVPREVVLTMSPGTRVTSHLLGSEVVVRCEVTGYPPPSLLILTHNNTLLTHGQEVLEDGLALQHRVRVNTRTTGLYKCEASYQGCEAPPCTLSTNTTVEVVVPVTTSVSIPDVEVVVSNTTLHTVVPVRRGSHPYVRCRGAGVPAPIQASLRVDGRYVSYTTLRNNTSLTTGRFVPVNHPVTVTCAAWQECSYSNCTHTTYLTLDPSIPSTPTVSSEKAYVLFFSAFLGSFLSLLVLFALFLICVDCCAKRPPSKPTSSNYTSYLVDLVKRYVMRVKTTTSHPPPAEVEFSLEAQTVRLSWDGTYETHLLEDTTQHKEVGFETESLCSGCHDLKTNCASQHLHSSLSLPSSPSSETVEDFLSNCKYMSEDQRQFLSPLENEYESLTTTPVSSPEGLTSTDTSDVPL